MNKLPPFHFVNPVPPELYVNRLYELDTIIKTLTLFRRHILVSGPRRIGKTSTLRKVYSILQETDEDKRSGKIFGVYSGYLLDYHEDLLGFFKGLILDLCSAVLDKQYGIELPILEAIDSRDLKDSLVKERETLLDIYQALKSDRTVSLTETSKLGVEFYAVGTKEASESTQFGRLSPDYRDLLKILDKILSILKKKNYDSVVLFLDDINGNLKHLLSKEGTQLLQLLAEKQVTLVASIWEITLTKVKALVHNERFVDNIKLAPFARVEILRELLRLYTSPPYYSGPQIAFSDEIIELIWKVTNGYPQFIQEICYQCYAESLDLGITDVSKEMVYKAALEITRRSPPDLYSQQ